MVFHSVFRWSRRCRHIHCAPLHSSSSPALLGLTPYHTYWMMLECLRCVGCLLLHLVPESLVLCKLGKVKKFQLKRLILSMGNERADAITPPPPLGLRLKKKVHGWTGQEIGYDNVFWNWAVMTVEFAELISQLKRNLTTIKYIDFEIIHGLFNLRFVQLYQQILYCRCCRVMKIHALTILRKFTSKIVFDVLFTSTNF